MKNVKQIEELLKAEGISEEELRERITLFDNLDCAISELLRKIPEFKGLEIYGSILNSRFNAKSDIDIFTFWEDYTPGDIKNWRYLGSKTIEGNVGDTLGSALKRRIHGWDRYINNKYPGELSTGNVRLNEAGIPFGIFLGNEPYINQLRTEILKAIESSGRSNCWQLSQDHFNSWGHKDLTNPQKRYELSDFQQLKNLHII